MSLFPVIPAYYAVSGGDPYFSNVVLLLPFDTDYRTGLSDISPTTPHTLTAAGNAAISSAQAPYGTTSLELDGTGDRVSAPDSADWAFGSGAFTIECWVRPANITAGTRFIMAQWQSSGNLSWVLYHDAGTLSFNTSTTGSNNNVDLTAASQLAATTWKHVAVSYNGSKFRLRVDGVMVNSNTVSRTLFDSGNVMSIGSNSSNDNFFFNGHIKGVRITKGVDRYDTDSTVSISTAPYSVGSDDASWSSVVLLAEFEQTTGNVDTDLSPTTPHTMTANGSAHVSTIITPPFDNRSLILNGTNAYVSAPSDSDWGYLDTDHTIECWIRFNALSKNQCIAAHWSNTAGIDGWYFWVNSSNQLEYTQNDGFTNFTTASSGWSPVVNVWYHVAADCTSTGVTRVRVNGVMLGKVSHTMDIDAGTATLNIGRRGNSADMFFDGQIKAFRMTKGVARYATDSDVTITAEAWPIE